MASSIFLYLTYAVISAPATMTTTASEVQRRTWRLRLRFGLPAGRCPSITNKNTSSRLPAIEAVVGRLPCLTDMAVMSDPAAPRHASVRLAYRRVGMYAPAMITREDNALSSAELLTDAFGRIRETVLAVVQGLTPDQLTHRLDRDANPVGWLVWH